MESLITNTSAVCIAEELSDAKFLPKQDIIVIIEELVMQFLSAVCRGEDPTMTLVWKGSSQLIQ